MKPHTYISIADLADQEKERLRIHIEALPQSVAFGNNALSALNLGIVGYAASRKDFGYYLSQMNVSLALALLSSLRQHEVQIYTNLRHAVEAAALACFALHHSDEKTFFSTEGDDPVDHERLLKRVVYPWFDSTLPQESEELTNQAGN